MKTYHSILNPLQNGRVEVVSESMDNGLIRAILESTENGSQHQHAVVKLKRVGHSTFQLRNNFRPIVRAVVLCNEINE